MTPTSEQKAQLLHIQRQLDSLWPHIERLMRLARFVIPIGLLFMIAMGYVMNMVFFVHELVPGGTWRTVLTILGTGGVLMTMMSLYYAAFGTTTLQVPSKFRLRDSMHDQYDTWTEVQQASYWQQHVDQRLPQIKDRVSLTNAMTDQQWRVNYCNVCRLAKPDRTHHCKICNRCIPMMDHHCPLIGVCVSAANKKAFVLFLIYGSLLFAGYGLCSIPYTYLLVVHWVDDRWPAAVTLVTCQVLISILGANVLIVQLIHQLPVISLNETTVEQKTRVTKYRRHRIMTYDMGTIRDNFALIFGDEYWQWPWPQIVPDHQFTYDCVLEPEIM